jgi:hypothetical protein
MSRLHENVPLRPEGTGSADDHDRDQTTGTDAGRGGGSDGDQLRHHDLVKPLRLTGPAGVSHNHQATGSPRGIKPRIRLGSGGAYPTGRDPWGKTSSIRLGSDGAYPTGRDTPSAQRQQPSTIPLSDPFTFTTKSSCSGKGDFQSKRGEN